jgi:hypothetical protein
MVNRPLEIAEPVRTLAMARRVYCAENAPLRLANGTPVHLEWIIEGDDGQLYRVPSAPGGWLQRTLYKGPLDRLRLVSSQKAETILWLTYADTDSPEPLGARDYSLEHWAY